MPNVNLELRDRQGKTPFFKVKLFQNFRTIKIIPSFLDKIKEKNKTKLNKTK